MLPILLPAMPPWPKEEEDTGGAGSCWASQTLPVGPQLPTEYLAWHSPRLFHPESESLRRGGNGSSCLPPGGQQGLGSVLRLHHGDHPAQGQSRVARARCSGHADDCSRDTCPHPHGYIHHQGGGPRQGLAQYLTLLQARPQAKVHFQED